MLGSSLRGKSKMEECQCTTKRLSLRTVFGGKSHYCYQCLVCGRSSSFIKKEEADRLVSNGESVSPFDDKAQDRYHALRIEQFQAEKELREIAKNQACTERKQDYHEYLNSVNWRVIRNKVMARCGGICEGCFDKKAVHVHHKTYDNVFNELMFQLVGLCEDCHAKLHPGAANE